MTRFMTRLKMRASRAPGPAWRNVLRCIVMGGLLVVALPLPGCKPAEPPAGSDPAIAQAALQAHTERLLWIHYRLDSALTEIEQAETKAREGNTSAAAYHAAEAFRYVQAADEAVLEQGLDLQRRFNLDAARANRN
jgi:hypothetical protein